MAADHFYSFSYRMLVGKVLLEDLLYFGVYLFSAQYVLYTILIAMLFYHSEDIDRKNTLQKRFVLYLGNYSFGIFLIHIFYVSVYRVSAAFAADNAFDADFLSAAVRFDAGIESWEYGNTGAASFSRAADREG
ncbi:MAG: hypothetical protein ACLR2G_11830 [Phascolarctobacterium faecium]